MIFFLAFLLIAPAHSFNIKCHFAMGDYDQLGTPYVCHVESVDWHGHSGQFKVTSTSGTHLSGKSNSHVQLISFGDQHNIFTVPKNLKAFFPNFVGFFFYYCDNLKRLTGNEFEEYPKLNWLAIFFSNINHIPGNLFSKNPDMKFIRFAFTDIVNIGPKLFDYSSK